MNQPAPEALRVAESTRTIALQMMSERGRGAVLVGGARVDAALEALLSSIGPSIRAGDPLPHRSTSGILWGPNRTGSATWLDRQAS